MKQFLFISNNCTDDYLQRANNRLYSPFNHGTIDFQSFINISNNFSVIDFSKIEFIPVEKCKCNQLHYNIGFRDFNNKNNINELNTFAIRFGFKDKNITSEVYYQHYEFNYKNVNSIIRRIARMKKYLSEQHLIPFFVFQISHDAKEEMKKQMNQEVESYIRFYSQQFLKNDRHDRLFIYGDASSSEHNTMKSNSLYDNVVSEISSHIQKYIEQ